MNPLQNPLHPPEMTAFFNLENLLRPENAAVVLGAWLMTEFLKRLLHSLNVPDESRLSKLVPAVWPIVAAQLLLAITIPWQPHTPLGERVVLGFVLGFASTHATLLLKRMGAGFVVQVVTGRFEKDVDEGDRAPDPREGFTPRTRPSDPGIVTFGHVPDKARDEQPPA